MTNIVLKEIPKPDEVLDLFSLPRIKTLYEDVNNNLVEQILQGRVEGVLVINNTDVRNEAEIRKSDVLSVMKKVKTDLKKKGWRFNYNLLISNDDNNRVINVKTWWTPLKDKTHIIKNVPMYFTIIGIIIFVATVITAAFQL